MHSQSLITRTIGVAALALLIPWSAAGFATAETKTGEHGSGMVTQGLGRIAVGSVEDTLEACLGRIPAEATSGQRVLAESTCRADEANRVVTHEAPEF